MPCLNFRGILMGSVLLAALLLPRPGVGQDPDRDHSAIPGWDAPWVAGWSLGASRDMASEFGSLNPCRSGGPNPAGEARLTLRRGVGSHLAVEGTLALVRELGDGGACLTGAPFPPFFDGIQTTTRIRHGAQDGRYLRPGLRLVGRRTSAHDTEFRIFVGAAMAPAYRSAGPAAGAAAAFGSGRFRLLLEAEGWVHAFPMASVTRVWEGGQVVSVQEERFQGDWNRDWTFRAGVEFHPR